MGNTEFAHMPPGACARRRAGRPRTCAVGQSRNIWVCERVVRVARSYLPFHLTRLFLLVVARCNPTALRLNQAESPAGERLSASHERETTRARNGQGIDRLAAGQPIQCRRLLTSHRA